ncbi:MAG: hypothetical protein KDA32_02290 [Phycisphaerales bacterium]|nr:hypothetical protein [Phycisphaerales bacterium]
MSLAIAGLTGCLTSATSTSTSAFATFTELFGDFDFGDVNTDTTGGRPTLADATFRSMVSLTFANAAADADMETSLVAWVNGNSITSAAQEDTLINNGYVQLTTETRLGTALVLPIGTFVYGGPGVAGSTRVRLGAGTAGEGDGAAVEPSTRTFQLITPDGILVFEDPPVSCESAAFVFKQDGRPLESEAIPQGLGDVFEGATGAGGIKTLAQVDAYECDPLRPGLFFRSGGGTLATNEYREGAAITITFFLEPGPNGAAAVVTIN